MSNMVTAQRIIQKLFVVLDQREDIDAVELLAPIEESELHGEGRAFYRAAEFLNKFCGCGSSAAGGQ